MSGEPPITVIGNLTHTPELRFTPAGRAVLNIQVASTPRVFKDGQWADGETLFLKGSYWNEAAENANESLEKGMRVIVVGRLKSRSYETREKEKRTTIELEVEEIGPSLRYATAKVSRTTRGGGSQAGANDYDATRGKAQDDGWTPAVSNQGGWGNNDSEPPF